ncbi:MAG: HAMP domain-containing protein [Desulfobacterales bacterium]|nr:HAMP domain-containing protein [Desulfobacterales bacterium]
MLLKPSARYRMRLGEVLLNKKLVTREQLQNALSEKRDRLCHFGTSVHTGKILVEQGIASEADVINAINEHYRISIGTLEEDIEPIIEEKRRGLLERIPKPRIPIWLQLSLATTFIILMTTFSLSMVTLNRQQKQLRKQTEKVGRVSLNYFANSARVPLLEDDIPALNTLIKEAATVEELRYAVIVDTRDLIKAHTDLGKLGMKLERRASIEDVVEMGDASYFDYVDASGERILNLTRPVMFQNKRLGAVHVGVSVDHIERTIREDRVSILATALVVLCVGVFFAIHRGLRFSRPISELVTATDEIVQGNYRYKVDLTLNNEIGDLAEAFNLMNQELLIKSFMQESFGKYVGREILSMIMDDPENTWLKGRRAEATVIFSDIRGFTAYSESKEPEEIVEALNQYFEIATTTVLARGGYVDKFIGDAVLGVFGAPVHYADHPERAVRAAMDMQATFRAAGGGRLLGAVGVGIHSGVVVSGNIGSQGKMEYTVIGDSVNVASHICQVAGPGEIVVSETVQRELADVIEVEPLPPRKMKGRVEPVRIFKVLNVKERTIVSDNY